MLELPEVAKETPFNLSNKCFCTNGPQKCMKQEATDSEFTSTMDQNLYF